MQRAFAVDQPNRVWVTDITYLRTYEGWLYLAVVIDLFSRQVIGWSMQPRIDRELAINALLMAVWRRRPTNEVLVHSDQGSQFSSYDSQDFLAQHNPKASMSRRGPRRVEPNASRSEKSVAASECPAGNLIVLAPTARRLRASRSTRNYLNGQY